MADKTKKSKSDIKKETASELDRYVQFYTKELMLDAREAEALKAATQNYIAATGNRPATVNEVYDYLGDYRQAIDYKQYVRQQALAAAKTDESIDAEYEQKKFLEVYPYTPTNYDELRSSIAAEKTEQMENDGWVTPTASTKKDDGWVTPTASTKKDDGWVTPTASTKKDDGWVTPTASKKQAPQPSVAQTQVSSTGAGSRTSPLPNSVAAQAKATAGQWIMTRNGPYQLKQADIDWAKRKVSQAQQPAKQNAPANQAPADDLYAKQQAEKKAQHKEDKAIRDTESNGGNTEGTMPAGGWLYTMKDGKVMYQDPENPAGPPKVADSREQYNNIVRALSGRRF